MVGHKLGEFSPTRSFRGHAGAKIKVKNKKQWEFVKRNSRCEKRLISLLLAKLNNCLLHLENALSSGLGKRSEGREH
jgi:hypothetical protein